MVFACTSRSVFNIMIKGFFTDLKYNWHSKIVFSNQWTSRQLFLFTIPIMPLTAYTVDQRLNTLVCLIVAHESLKSVSSCLAFSWSAAMWTQVKLCKFNHVTVLWLALLAHELDHDQFTCSNVTQGYYYALLLD